VILKIVLKAGRNMQLYIPDKIISEIGRVARTESLKRLSEQSLDLVSLLKDGNHCYQLRGMILLL
jgi:hypothetical protein